MESGNSSAGDIQIQVRHLSPIGQILPKSWFDFLVKFSPQASRLGNRNGSKPEENARDLLKVKIGEFYLLADRANTVMIHHRQYDSLTRMPY